MTVRLLQIMTALYDYNPEEQSPKDNPDSELAFKKGQVIKVFGDMVRCAGLACVVSVCCTAVA